MTTIYLYGKVNHRSAEKVVQDLLEVASSGLANPTVDLHITSPGGYVDSMWAIVDAIESAKAAGVHVTTYASGLVASAGAMIFIAGSERLISPNAELLLHYGETWLGVNSELNFRGQTKHLERHLARICDHIERHTKVTELDDRMRDDAFYLTADDAIKYGAADRTIW